MQTVDWFRLIWDLHQRGMRTPDIAGRIGQNRETVRNYLHGAHPPHWRGELLIRLWSEVCQQPRENVPMCELVIMPRVVNRSEQRVSVDAVRELARAWR